MMQRQVTDNIFVLAMAVDYQDGHYRVYASILNPERSGGQAEENEPDMPAIINATGKSLSNAMYNMRKDFPRFINLSRNRVLVLGKSALREGLHDIIDFYMRSHETQLSARVYVYDGDIGEVLTNSMHNAVDPAMALYEMAAFGREAGLFITPIALDIAMHLYDSTTALTIPIFERKAPDPEMHGQASENKPHGGEDQQNEEEGEMGVDPSDSLILSGAALLQDGRYAANLSPEVSIPMTQLLLSGHGRDVHTVPLGNNARAGVQTLRRKNRLSVSLDGNVPILRVNVEVEGQLIDLQGNVDLMKISEQYGEAIKHEVLLVLHTLYIERGADALGFGRKLLRRGRRAEVDWRAAELDVWVEARVTQSGQIQ